MSSSTIADRLSQVSQQVRAAKSRGQNVSLLAVSKTFPFDKILEVHAQGHRDFAENYVQELAEKAAQAETQGVLDIRWHFIGHLQTNKVKQLLPFVHSIHSVDSEKLAREIAKRWAALGRTKPLSIFLEVNLDGEASKSGLAPQAVSALAELIGRELSGLLRLEGLMCVPAPGSADSARAAFARLRALEEACRPWSHGALSMGMSGDFEIAIEEGSTHVRVGTAIFGKR